MLDNTEDVSCMGKVPFDSWTHAKKAIRKHLHRRLNIYRCKKCRQFHIGEKQRRFKK